MLGFFLIGSITTNNIIMLGHLILYSQLIFINIMPSRFFLRFNKLLIAILCPHNKGTFSKSLEPGVYMHICVCFIYINKIIIDFQIYVSLNKGFFTVVSK